MLGEAIKVSALLVELLTELEKLLLLALADGVVLAGLLTALESITSDSEGVSTAYPGKLRDSASLKICRPRGAWKEVVVNVPLAAHLGGRAGVSLAHCASSGCEGGPDGTESRGLRESGAKHLGGMVRKITVVAGLCEHSPVSSGGVEEASKQDGWDDVMLGLA